MDILGGTVLLQLYLQLISKAKSSSKLKIKKNDNLLMLILGKICFSLFLSLLCGVYISVVIKGDFSVVLRICISICFKNAVTSEIA